MSKISYLVTLLIFLAPPTWAAAANERSLTTLISTIASSKGYAARTTFGRADSVWVSFREIPNFRMHVAHDGSIQADGLSADQLRIVAKTTADIDALAEKSVAISIAKKPCHTSECLNEHLFHALKQIDTASLLESNAKALALNLDERSASVSETLLNWSTSLFDTLIPSAHAWGDQPSIAQQKGIGVRPFGQSLRNFLALVACIGGSIGLHNLLSSFGIHIGPENIKGMACILAAPPLALGMFFKLLSPRSEIVRRVNEYDGRRF